ncbi:acyl carrier protein [Paenibacillus sp. FSL H8-0332]|uniref:acyl carrier protein n=1 Tax=Paenibacillus sp. FSL H8-0332 TaxID=2954742 RepID=UPI0030D24916
MENNILEEIKITLNEMLLENTGDTYPKLNINNNLREDLHFDSFDMAELTVRIEAKFGVDIFEGGHIYTVNDILQKLELKR